MLALQADGSAMYTLQALWTQAREGLDVTTVIIANRGYQILAIEMQRAGIDEPGPVIGPLTDLGSPTLDWVALAARHGRARGPGDDRRGADRRAGAARSASPGRISSKRCCSPFG